MQQEGYAKPFVVVTDATMLGDDGVAISILLENPSVDIKLIVCASGNVWADEVEINVRQLLGRFNRLDIPVCVGSSNEPYEGRIAQFSHQTATMKVQYAGALATPLPPLNNRYADGFQKFVEIVRNTDRMNLLIIAPSTPVAAMLREAPELKPRIGDVFIMGGALEVPGNATKFAEFNFWFDPRAAADLLASGLNITLLPLDAIGSLAYSLQAVGSLHSDRPSMAYLREYLAERKTRKKNGFPLWDEALSGILLQPALVERIRLAELNVVRSGAQIGKLRSVANGKRHKIKVISGLNKKKLDAFVMESLSR